MNYAAVNAKVRAMGADTESPARSDDLARISRWLPEKRLCDFVALMMGERDIPGYLYLWQRLHRLDKPNRRALSPLVGMEIDLRNLVWIYRLKHFYGVAGGETFGRLIPLRYRLSEGHMRQMADAKDEKSLLAIIAQSPYAAIFSALEGAEQAINRALTRQYKRQARLYPHTLAPVCRYLFARKMEARNRRAMAEGQAQGLAPEEIQRYVVEPW